MSRNLRANGREAGQRYGIYGEVRRGTLEKMTKSNRTSRETEYAGCILVDYKLRSRYETDGLIYRRGMGMYGDGAE